MAILFFKQQSHPPSAVLPIPATCNSPAGMFHIPYLLFLSPPLVPFLIAVSPPFPRLPLSSHTDFTSLFPFLRFVPSSLSWVLLLSYILQPSAASLFTPLCISYITLLCSLAAPLLPSLVVSFPVSVSGRQPHTRLIDFSEHHANIQPMHGP